MLMPPPKLASGTMRVADDEQRVAGGILNRVARFVRSDADGGHRAALVHLRAQPQNFAARVVVIGHEAFDRLDGDVLQAGRVEHVPGGGRTGHRAGSCCGSAKADFTRI